MLSQLASTRTRKVAIFSLVLVAMLAIPSASFAGGRHGRGGGSWGGGHSGHWDRGGGWDRGRSHSSLSISFGFGNVFSSGRSYGRYYDDCYVPSRVVYRDYDYCAPTYYRATYYEPVYYAQPVYYAPVRTYYSSDYYCAPRYRSDVSIRYTYRR